MVDGHCVCALRPELDLETHVSIVFHYREWRKTTNTGHLLLQCLKRSASFLWGLEGQDEGDLGGLVPEGSQGLVLTPKGEALTPALIEHCQKKGPLSLVAVDGNWRQAGRMVRRVPGLSELIPVALTGEKPTRYRLRNETKEHGLATFEALSQALGLIHGQEVEEALDRFFLAMVEGTLASRA